MRSGVLICAVWLSVSTAMAEDDRIRFNRDVRPILSERCFRCHGPDARARKAKLRLDVRDSAISARGAIENSAAIVPGNTDRSELLRRIDSADESERMPPADVAAPLSKSQRAILRRWIEQGAPYEGHWAFDRPERVAPRAADSGWALTTIDRFILERLVREGLEPSEEASPETLVRRLHLDLTGLLPDLETVEAFCRDASPAAYEALVDRLLASPHFGERWGRHWLDQARYADSHGYSHDNPRAMWAYRNWVIDAVNGDMPFDRFSIEQLAGDLLESPTTSQLVATGFHRNTLISMEGGSDREQFRVESVVDRVNTTASVWLGLTIGCAQCHDHKFDPIRHDEYYRLYAFFNNTEDSNGSGPTIDVTYPSGKTKAMILRERKSPRDTHVHIRGDFLRKGDPVSPGVPETLGGKGAELRTRLDLARWLVSESNPLTARVTVNRFWMRLFGRGLVDTENDFGSQGTLPTHPELLDWLATEFIRQDWSAKSLIREILLSATYRQSSTHREDLLEVDADNRLLARQSRIRLDAEVVRDVALCASGSLTRKIGGPSVYPPQPEGVYAFTQVRHKWPESRGADRFRRGMYTFYFRNTPYPMLSVFDAPSFQTSCTRRFTSNTPLQALTLSNGKAMHELASALGERARESGLDDRDRLNRAFRWCMSRSPTADERIRLHRFLDAQREFYKARPAYAEKAGGTGGESHERAAWIALARVLMNLDEFITRE